MQAKRFYTIALIISNGGLGLVQNAHATCPGDPIQGGSYCLYYAATSASGGDVAGTTQQLLASNMFPFTGLAITINFTVTPAAGVGGSINPNTAQTVTPGTTSSFTVTPNSGYTRNNTVGGTCPPGSWNGNVWTTGFIVANCNVNFSFTSLITPPTAITNAASNITVTSATLNGNVTSNGATTAVTFDFGTSTAYGTNIAATPAQVYSSTAVVVSTAKTGLTCGTVYHYRVKAVNSNGTGYGADKSFTTADCPTSINSWLYPVNPTIIVDHDFTLDLHVDSKGVKVGSYDFQINFDQERLVVDDTQCDSGVCPGTDAVDTSTVVTDNNTGVIKVAGFDMDGVGPNNDLQLLVIHFKTKITPGPTLIDLTTNELATVLGEVIGLGSRDNLVTISPGICGDADGNGAVNIVDALAIARRAVGLPPPPTVNTLWADVNQNQITNITDAMLIARHSVGMLVVGTCNIGQALPL